MMTVREVAKVVGPDEEHLEPNKAEIQKLITTRSNMPAEQQRPHREFGEKVADH
jgi:hypothetical protein